jgi:hypothetical protein
MAAKRKTTSDRTSYRMTPGAPAPKSSQGGYGHKSTTGGRTAPQGSRRNPVKK